MNKFRQIAKIPTGGVVKDTSKLLFANVFAQALGLAVYPILSRLYAPDDFGLLNLFLSIGGVMILFATGQYHCAVVLPKTQQEGNACFQLGMLINAAVLLLLLLSVPFSTSIASLFNAPALASWYFLLPLYVFLMALWQLLNYWYVRQKSYNRISWYQVTQSATSATGKIAFGYGGFMPGGLMVATVLAPVVALLTTLLRSYKKLAALCQVDGALCKKMASVYRKFPQFTLPKSIVNYVSNNLPTLLLVPFFGLTEIGYWGMAMALAFTPIYQVSHSLYQVLFQHVVDRVNQQQHIGAFMAKIMGTLVGGMLLLFVPLYWLLPSLVEWLLGSNWAVVATYIRFLLPWLLVVTLYTCTDFVVDIFNKQDKQFYFELALLLVRLLAVIPGILLQDFMVAIVCFVMGSCLLRVGYIVYLCVLIKKYEKSIAGN